jgi:hypothetical protein
VSARFTFEPAAMYREDRCCGPDPSGYPAIVLPDGPHNLPRGIVGQRWQPPLNREDVAEAGVAGRHERDTGLLAHPVNGGDHAFE